MNEFPVDRTVGLPTSLDRAAQDHREFCELLEQHEPAVGQPANGVDGESGRGHPPASC